MKAPPMMRTVWVVRDRREGYLLDTCAGGTFTGPEALAWDEVRVFNEVLVWSNQYDAMDAMRVAEIEPSDDVDVYPIDVPV